MAKPNAQIVLRYSPYGLSSHDMSTLTIDGNITGIDNLGDQTLVNQIKSLADAMADAVPDTGAIKEYTVRTIAPDGSIALSVTEGLAVIGKWHIPDGEKLAPDYVAFVFDKKVTGLGRTRGMLKGVLTNTEFKTYLETGVPPVRLAPPPGLVQTVANSIAMKMGNILIASGPFRAALPDKKSRKTGSLTPRVCTSFAYREITKNDKTRNKTSATTDAVRSAKKRLSEFSAEVRSIAAPYLGAALPASAQADENAVKSEAKTYRDALPSAVRARAPMPANLL